MMGASKGHPLDYRMAEVTGSKLQFRGPLPIDGRPFVSILGGSEAFGRFVERPFPAILADWLETPVANLGVVQAGLSLFAGDTSVLNYASQARVAVVQLLEPTNMSNRLYHVHPRRNDRFLGVSPALREMFPSVDFAEINFTGHLIDTLRQTSSDAFDVLVDELKQAWLQRMHSLLEKIECDVMFLRITRERPSNAVLDPRDQTLIDNAMINKFRSDIVGVAEIALPPEVSLEGKTFAKSERSAALGSLGPVAHAKIAEALLPWLSDVLSGPGCKDTAARAARL